MRAFLLSMLTLLPFAAQAQSAPVCPDSGLHFEFQTSRPARWVSDTTLVVRPTAAIQNPANLVQFVVDPAGVPEPRSFRVLRSTDSALVVDVRQTFVRWRYSSAMMHGCRVRQLIQTPVGR